MNSCVGAWHRINVERRRGDKKGRTGRRKMRRKRVPHFSLSDSRLCTLLLSGHRSGGKVQIIPPLSSRLRRDGEVGQPSHWLPSLPNLTTQQSPSDVPSGPGKAPKSEERGPGQARGDRAPRGAACNRGQRLNLAFLLLGALPPGKRGKAGRETAPTLRRGITSSEATCNTRVLTAFSSSRLGSSLR